MKKLLSLALTITMSISLAYSEIHSGTCGANGDNLTWELSDDSVLTISGNGAMKDYQLYESENPWFNYSGEINSVIVEEGVTYIGMSAFEHDSHVETIQLPNSLISIGSRAFVWCERLKELEMPNSVVSIQDNLFGACMSLKEVTLSTELTEIPEYTFNGCPIKSIVVPDKVRKIGQFAFAWCDSLESITMPNEIYEIGGNNFVDCRSLTEFIFPDSLTEIGDGMFIGCTNLTHIDIHERITAIGIRAFERAGLQSIICRVVNPPVLAREPFLGNGVFQDVDKTIPLYVPSESIEAYKAADQWNEFFNILPLDAIPTSSEHSTEQRIPQKLIRNGQLFILHGNKTYTIQGQEVR